MKRTHVHIRPRGGLTAVGVTLFLLLTALPGDQLLRASADDGQQEVVRVEEDWCLVLNEPGDQIGAPQFHTLMAPGKGVDGAYVQISWNYRELPEFAAGGFQLQGWLDSEDMDLREFGDVPLSQQAETVTWTQRLETNGTMLFGRVVNGQSSSWGAFGGDSTQVCVATPIRNLNGYLTSVSQQNSGVTYGSNRVSSLVITEVRRYGVNGLISRDTARVVVFQLDEDES